MSNFVLKEKHMGSVGRKIMTGILVCLLFTAGVSIMAKDGAKKPGKYAPVVQDLKDLYDGNEDFAKLVDNALKSAVVPPDGWPYDPLNPRKLFIWQEKNFDDFLDLFQGWLTFVPNHKNGMSYYELLYGLCYNNEYALKFVETDPGLSWTREFVKARGKYMDSEDSIYTDKTHKIFKKAMWDWYKALGDHWNDFKPPHPPNVGFKGYKTFSEFFTRKLREPDVRPVSYPDDDSILVAPADGLVNMVNSNLDTDSIIHTKYDEYLNIDQLLDGSKYAKYFLGGTAVDTVLLPPDYHRYHSPAAGHVVESKEVDADDGFYFGMDGEFFTFSNNGNIGGYKSKYGIFGRYHRGYYIIKTDHFGYIAMIPIGLDDISSVNFVEKFRNVTCAKPEPVKKGEEVGYFAYGGSTIILLFQPGVLFGLKTEQGNQIGVMNAIDHEKKTIPTLHHYYHYKKKVDK
jgi:phosphatidylserine decarboxylase